MSRSLIALVLAASLGCANELAIPPSTTHPISDGSDLVYRLARFVLWPGSTNARETITIGIIGLDPVAAALPDLLVGRVLAGRPIIVRPLRSLQQARECDILFLGESARSQVPSIVAHLGPSSSVLTVSAMPGFSQMGGIAELVLWQPLRRPIILNADAARRSGLRFHAGLWAVSAITRTEASAH